MNEQINNSEMADLDATNSNKQQILPINKEAVHKICSGQVILNLSRAMKELVENSIDAGATIINIHLKERGVELLEVSDNGSGVPPENFEALTLKHYTSKIKAFDDLESLTTLGFRGEALSSLCALSDVVIITKDKNSEAATHLKYDHNGTIIEKFLTAREQGTTVRIENLFCTCPVRRKEFLKRTTCEYTKMLQLLNAYCLVSKGIKFTCTNTTAKGSKNVALSTHGSDDVKDNIIALFGADQLSTLIEVEPVTPDEKIQSECNINITSWEELPFTFEFLVSNIDQGYGRSNPNRQFYFINSRPCDFPVINKAINEIYRQNNKKEYPFVFLNIITKNSTVDVNVTADKRRIFLEKENYLLATVKASLLKAYEDSPTIYKRQNLDVTQTLINSFLEEEDKKALKKFRLPSEVNLKPGSIVDKFKKQSIKANHTKLTDNFLLKTDIADAAAKERVSKLVSNLDPGHKNSYSDVGSHSTKRIKLEHTLKMKRKQDEEDLTEIENEVDDKLNTLLNIAENLIENSDSENEENAKKYKIDNESSDDEDIVATIDVPNSKLENKNPVTVGITMDKIRTELNKNRKRGTGDLQVKFRSKISPDSNDKAEQELQKQLSKEDFKNMEVIGQFNLGFMITKLGSDLFIIDQHATDEKYNFEQLQLNTVLDSQVLVNPKQMELTAGNESILIENVEVFKKNGFSFKIDENAACTKKVFLTAVPVSHNVTFGKSDIEEMLFMLQDSAHTMVRPSRIRNMFASRACRKSVMIGKHLSTSDMRKLVDHMGEIDHPWNCPHGRPTMRHLVNLDLLEKTE